MQLPQRPDFVVQRREARVLAGSDDLAAPLEARLGADLPRAAVHDHARGAVIEVLPPQVADVLVHDELSAAEVGAVVELDRAVLGVAAPVAAALLGDLLRFAPLEPAGARF